MKSKLLILLNCFFNYELINRCLESICKVKKDDVEYDIIILENPSKYSDKIKELISKFTIYKHYICEENIEGNIFTLFVNTFPELIEEYDYIAMSEADVVLEEGSLQEAIEILDKKDIRVGNLSIDVELNYKKYYNLPIRTWIPIAKNIDGYDVGATGFQFIIFKRNFLKGFVSAINNKQLCSSVALGQGNYYGLSDSNLQIFNNQNRTLWVRTKKYKLDHIGWEMYINMDNEYVKTKQENLANKKIRHNMSIDNYKLVEQII